VTDEQKQRVRQAWNELKDAVDKPGGRIALFLIVGLPLLILLFALRAATR